MKVRNQREQEKIELQMTPMIDIVFQLLVFFIMTFKIVASEGDFNIKMPIGAPSEGSIDDIVPPMKLRLEADGNGTLTSISLQGRPISSMEQLTREISSIIGSERTPGGMHETAEVEIDADYNLDYVHTIDAITAVSGYVDPSTEKVVKMIEKIKFSPPKTPS